VSRSFFEKINLNLVKLRSVNLKNSVIDFLSKEYHQLFLWAPAGLIVGINSSLDSSVNLFFILAILFACISSFFLARKNIIFLFTAIILSSFLLGAISSYIRDKSITENKFDD